MIEADDPNLIRSQRKPISALIPYAIRLAQGGQQRIANVIMRASAAANLGGYHRRLWYPTKTYITPIFDASSPPSLNRAIVLISPYVYWDFQPYPQKAAVIRWVTAVSAVPCSEELVPKVVQKLLEIAIDDSLRPYVPLNVWVWLKKRPTLPPQCPGRRVEDWPGVVQHIRELEDIEILTSYFSLVLSEWDTFLSYWSLLSVKTLIQEDFSGIGVWRHRQELIERLDHILGQLGRELGYFKQHNPWIDEIGIQYRKEQYGELKKALLEADRSAMETLTRMSLDFITSHSSY